MGKLYFKPKIIMKKKLILLTALISISLIYYLNNNQVIEQKPNPKYSFGISEYEDIYTDTIDLRLYTSHGRLKQKYNDN
jgi:hypothetical protein